MADLTKFLFYNPDEQLTNAVEGDSLLFTSYKTTSWELTDTLLGQLTNDVILRDGTRAFNANQSLGNNLLTNVSSPVNSTDVANKQYVDNAVAGLNDFKKDVLSKDVTDPPGSPTTGDRYLIGLDPQAGIASGVWAGADGQITEWTGATWTFDTDITNGTFVFINDVSSQYRFAEGPGGFSDGEWILFNSGTVQPGDGIDITNNVASVDIATLSGLKFVGGQLAVEPEHLVDNVSLVDNGSDQFVINFANTSTEMASAKAVQAADLGGFAANQGAKVIGADPTNILQSVNTTVQGILEDLSTSIETNQPSVVYTAGVLLAKADVLYITSNDVVSKYPINDPSGKHPVGAALGDAAASGTVKVAQSNVDIAGAFTGKTAGQQLFWNSITGQHEAIAVNTSGVAVIQSGYAKNSTDLQVDVKLLRVNG